MNLLDLLKLYGFDPEVEFRLVRHTSDKHDLELVNRLGFMDEYTARQGRPVFHRCEQIVSFMGERGARSRFLGVFTVKGTIDPPPWTASYPYPDMNIGKFFYVLAKHPAYKELEERVVIDWAASTRAWGAARETGRAEDRTVLVRRERDGTG